MKRLIALLLALATAAALVLGTGWYLWAQPAASIVDRTMQTTPESAAEQAAAEAATRVGTAGGADPNTAVLNPNVQGFFGQDATDVYNAVTATAFDEEGRLQITLNSTSLAFAGLQAGDLFWIDGDETTLFQGPYIGKVADTRQDGTGSTVMTIENATMDEAFDALNVDIQAELTEDSLISIEAVDGVDLQMQQDALAVYDTLEGGSGLPAPEPVSEEELAQSIATAESQRQKLEALQGTSDSAAAMAASGTADSARAVPLGSNFTPATPAPAQSDRSDMVGAEVSVKKDGIVASLEVDLSKVFGMVKAGEDSGKDANDKMLDTLKKGALEHDLEQLKNASESSPTCKLTGKIALTDLSCELHSDWALAYLAETPGTLGFKQLSVDYSSNLEYDVNFEGTFKNYSISGVKSQFTAGSWLKFEGLPYKKFPLFCVRFGAGAPIQITQYPNRSTGLAKTAMENVGSILPQVIGVVYVDTDGKLSLTYSMNYNLQCYVEGTYTVVEDSQKVWRNEPGSQHKLSRSVSVALGFEADMDLNIDAALDVFFCGVNVLDLNLIKFGAELDGKGELKATFSNAATSDGMMDPNLSANLNVYLRFYIKAIDLGVKMRVSLAFLGQKLLSVGSDELRWTLLDYTLHSWGTKKTTSYDKDTMVYHLMTAEDRDNVYFLTEDQKIAKQSKATGFYSILCDAKMTRFAGIDESYLYYIKPGEKNYDLCRVDKNTGITRTLRTNVANALGEDETRLFYTDGDDKTVLLGLIRETQKDTVFAAFDDEVSMLVPYQDRFYTLTQSDDPWSALFGGGTHYYLLDSSGTVLQDLGESPSPQDLPRWKTEKDRYTCRLVGTGQLHSHATAMYWIDPASQESVELEGVSGWNELGADMCVTQKADEGSELPYIIRGYSAADGHRYDVVPVHSDQAFFTLCQAEDGSWYFFDEDTDAGELYLYHMDAGFGGKTLLATYSRDDIGVSLDDCGMELIAGKLIFYSITGSDNAATGRTLLRYDIY